MKRKWSTILFCEILLITLLISASTIGPWTRAQWPLANGKYFRWQSNLYKLKSASDCTTPASYKDFHSLCKATFKAFNGYFTRVIDQVCTIDSWSTTKGLSFASTSVISHDVCGRLKAVRKLTMTISLIMILAIICFIIALVLSILSNSSRRAKNSLSLQRAAVRAFAPGIMCLAGALLVYALFVNRAIGVIFNDVVDVTADGKKYIMSPMVRLSYSYWTLLAITSLYFTLWVYMIASTLKTTKHNSIGRRTLDDERPLLLSGGGSERRKRQTQNSRSPQMGFWTFVPS